MNSRRQFLNFLAASPLALYGQDKESIVDPKDITPPEPAKFEDAVARAGRQLFAQAQSVLGPAPRLLVIDPLIDANTGGQTVSTEQMGNQLESVAKAARRTFSGRRRASVSSPCPTLPRTCRSSPDRATRS